MCVNSCTIRVSRYSHVWAQARGSSPHATFTVAVLVVGLAHLPTVALILPVAEPHFELLDELLPGARPALHIAIRALVPLDVFPNEVEATLDRT